MTGRTSPIPFPALRCAGVPIAAISPQAGELVVGLAEQVVGQDNGFDIHLCNTFTLSLADDPYYLLCLQEASVNLADGWPIVAANRILHRQDPSMHQGRVRGPSLFVDVLDAGRAHGIRHYLLGSTPETLNLLQEAIESRFPGTGIVGVESPPFRIMTLNERLEQNRRIRESGAQIVWVGLGTPKQDYECAALAEELPVVAIGVGAAFDFVAGTVQEAPDWMQDHGMEWAHRLASEPKRLWRRYLIGGPRFAKAVVTRRQQ